MVPGISRTCWKACSILNLSISTFSTNVTLFNKILTNEDNYSICFYELTFILFKVYSKLPRWVPSVLLHPIYSHYKCNKHRKHINNASIERSINSFLFLLRHFISDIYIIYHSTCSVSVSVFFTPVESLSMTLIRPRSNFYAISNRVSFSVFSFLIWTSWTRGHGENKVRTGLYECAYITGRKKKKLA